MTRVLLALVVASAALPAHAESRLRRGKPLAVTQRQYPLFIEGVADFNSGAFELPAGYLNHPIPGAAGYELTLTVTGAEGATTLAVNAGAVADAGVSSQGWGAVVQHDDGTWGVYSVTASDLATTVTIRPGLRKAATGKSLSNIHDLPNGQHLTPNGSRALAEHIWLYPGWKAYRRGFIAQHREDATSDGPWVEINGLPEAWLAFSGLALNYYPSASPAATFARTRNKYGALVAASANGTQGIQWTQPLYGKTGYVDSYFGTETNAPAFRVEIIIDGVTKLDKWTNGLERFAVQFTNATTGIIRYTLPTGDGAQSYKYRLGTTTWWEVPSDVPATPFHDGARVVYVGDSWGTYYSGLLPATLASHITAAGGSLVNVAVGGQTAQWARDNFASLVVANDPDIAIFEFFVNDRNALGAAGVATWKANIDWLVAACLARGIRPVVVMPVPTSSAVQAQDLAFYGASLAEGWLSQ